MWSWGSRGMGVRSSGAKPVNLGPQPILPFHTIHTLPLLHNSAPAGRNRARGSEGDVPSPHAYVVFGTGGVASMTVVN